MNPHLLLRHLLALLATLLIFMALGTTGASATTGFGEVGRFGERVGQKSDKEAPTLGVLAGAKKGEEPLHYAIGVDPSEGNDVFVLDEPNVPKETHKDELCTTTRQVRIQKFTPSGSPLASVTFAVTSPEVEPSGGECEDSEVEDFSNIAVDPETGVVYVLSTEPREAGLTADAEAPAATTLYAFKTKESGKELVSATPDSEGVLANAATLGAESDEPGKALLEPRGITVDPKTHEVVILGHIDEKGAAQDEIANDRFALQRVTDEGHLGQRYVDKKGFFEAHARTKLSFPSSPVVTGQEKVLVRFEGITEIPNEFESATNKQEEPKQVYDEPVNTIGVLNFGEENEAGGGLSLSPEGNLFEPASIENEAITEGLSEKAGIAERSLASLGSGGGLLGWSGGQSQVIKPQDQCVLEPGEEEAPLYIAAGSEGKVFVLAPEYLDAAEPPLFKPFSKDAVVELGPGGSGCPTAKGSSVTLTKDKEQLPESEPVSNAAELEFSTKVDQADALDATWTIENKANKNEKTVITPDPLEFVTEPGIDQERELVQQPKLAFKFKSAFAGGGEYLVSAKIQTDDLAGPEEVETAKRTVIVDVPAEVIKQPQSESVVEGSTVTFTAEAAGLPKPTVQWEVSTDEGKEFKADTTDSGNTTDTLTVKSVTLSENKYEYRARFQNTVEGEVVKVESSAATLTVTAKSSEEEPQVTVQPKSQEVTEPATATFTAEASGAPTPTVQWEVSTDGGTEFAPDTTDPGNTTDTLKVEHTSKSESGREYRATFKNTVKGVEKTATSDSATLTVKELVEEEPVITHQPENKEVTEPGEATFVARASGSPTPSVQWEVSTDEGKEFKPDTTDSGNTTETLKVEHTTKSESGREYRATFKNIVKGVEKTATSRAATLTVKEAAKQEAPKKEESKPTESPIVEVLHEHIVQPPPPSPNAVIAGVSISVKSSGALTLKITCPAGETRCIGTVTIRTLTAVSASSKGHESKAKRAILTLASGSFSVAGGGAQTLTLHLTGAARALLGHAHTLRAKAMISAHDLAGAKHTDEQIVTLRLVPAKKH
jgi:hypothetical protein